MLGLRFEEVIHERIEDYCGYKRATKEEDMLQGTDLFMYGLPIDITLNENKEGRDIGELDLCVSSIKARIRTGNGYHDFEHPVLVLLFCPRIPTDRLGLKMVAEELTETALEQLMDMFWDSL